MDTESDNIGDSNTDQS